MSKQSKDTIIANYILEMSQVKKFLESKTFLTAQESEVYNICRETFKALTPLVELYYSSSFNMQRPKINPVEEDALAMAAGLASVGVFEHEQVQVDPSLENNQIDEFHEMINSIDFDKD